MDVFNADKKTWLRYGPGGWLRKPRGKAKADEQVAKPIELRELPAWWEFRSALLRNLQNSPELRERLTAVLTQLARARDEQAKREEAALVRPAREGKKSE